jgi:G3E family GTPase
MHSQGFEVVLLTGFLGSGKTTLLKTFLSSGDAADVGVVVNEIGEIDVDGAVLAQSAEKVPLALLSNGCICCAADGDLAGTIAMLQEERARRGLPPLCRVIVETSGAARPGPVLRGLQLLGPAVRTRCISTLDAINWRRAMRTREGRAQLAGASRIVVTKMECGDEPSVRRACDAARAANPLCELITESSPFERARLCFAEGARASGAEFYPPASLVHATFTGEISTAILRLQTAIGYDELAEWLDNAAGLFGERLYRLKGFVRVRDQPRRVLVQGVGTTFAQPTLFLGEGTQSFLVAIGEGLGLDELQSIEPHLDAEIIVGEKRGATPMGSSLTRTIETLDSIGHSSCNAA